MKKKPSWFRIVDFLTMAGVGLLVAGLTVYAMIVGVEGPHATQGIVLCWVVALGFIGIWFRFCWVRKKDMDTYRWYPTYGFMFQPENYNAPTDAEFNALVSRAITAWSPYFPQAQQIIAQEEVIWVWMKKSLNENSNNLAHKPVHGLTPQDTYMIEVDYNAPTDSFDKTAFRHELGHIIMGHATGQWDNDTHHAFMKEHGLL